MRLEQARAIGAGLLLIGALALSAACMVALVVAVLT